MEELLTVKEVQDLLKVDRLTVYRMLKDGRLAGVKIGHQWRFSRTEVTSFLFGSRPSQTASGGNGHSDATQALPIHCVQMIQNVFGEITEVGAVTTDLGGEPLTEISNSCRFCEIIRSTEKGRQACAVSWRRLANRIDPEPRVATCHAGLQYAGAPIELKGTPAATIVAGQFYTQTPDPEEEAGRCTRLAREYGLDPEELNEAACSIQTLDEHKQAQLGSWLKSMAHTLEEVSRERADLMERLHTIAAMSIIEG